VTSKRAEHPTTAAASLILEKKKKQELRGFSQQPVSELSCSLGPLFGRAGRRSDGFRTAKSMMKRWPWIALVGVTVTAGLFWWRRASAQERSIWEEVLETPPQVPDGVWGTQSKAREVAKASHALKTPKSGSALSLKQWKNVLQAEHKAMYLGRDCAKEFKDRGAYPTLYFGPRGGSKHSDLHRIWNNPSAWTWANIRDLREALATGKFGLYCEKISGPDFTVTRLG